ncbi:MULTISPECIES: DMT family transporter [unclassified Devosia]|uniref:DMT family transporter n=1 Tax=unclassified Devosia TaxID=196773 RepID=UPI00086F67E3|nr:MULTISPECIES: DMT family transporter [unclassified Devosia]MBN9362014.1 DMT family transporter [Devosia sp.]ODS82531.1 MAG: multidrug DMT transporter [Devosia sp. SCN 66-27]OJX24709.1 MAG: multidrug DMT transporter [Devosia sp. 66-14]
MSSPFTDRRLVIAIALFCCFLWGSAVPAVKIGYGLFAIAPSDTPSLMLFAGARFFLAGVMLLGYSTLTRKPIVQPPRRLGQLGLLGLVSTAGQYLFYYIGLAHSTGVKVSIITSTSTFFSVLIAHFLYANDKLTPRRTLGCLLGFAGVVAVNLAAGGIDLHVSLLGEGFIVIAALLFAVGGVYGKGLSADMDAAVMTGWQLLLGGAILGLAGLVLGGSFGAFGLEAALLLAYLAALSAAAFALWSVLLKHNPVGSVSIFICAIPIFGVLLAGLFLGESIFEWKNLVALVLVSVGIWMVTATRRAV